MPKGLWRSSVCACAATCVDSIDEDGVRFECAAGSSALVDVSRMIVLLRWAFQYLTFQDGARLITRFEATNGRRLFDGQVLLGYYSSICHGHSHD